MKQFKSRGALVCTALAGIFLLQAGSASGAEEAATLAEAFTQGNVSGQLKSYYYAQTFDGTGLNNSQIWVNGGLLSYNTARFYGFKLGATFQASFVGWKDDEDGRTRGSMDADGAVLSEGYLDYKYMNTEFKGGRQFMAFPLLTGSGSRLIKESFESYVLSNSDIPGTTITGAYVTKYQTRSDQSNYGDNWFVEYDMNGTGDVGDFYDIGDDGMMLLYAKNNSIENLLVQAAYINVFGELGDFYADAKYTFDLDVKPYIAAQFYYTDYSDSSMDSNTLFGFKGGATIADVDLFAAFTTTGGDANDARVFRGVGQGAYQIFTATTKSVGVLGYMADTESYQIGAAYKYEGLSTMLRGSIFDLPGNNTDLTEYTLNLAYALPGWAKGFSVAVDFSILDYDNDQKDATDLRTRLIYSF